MNKTRPARPAVESVASDEIGGDLFSLVGPPRARDESAVNVARLAEIREDGVPLVLSAGEAIARPARRTVALTQADVGADILVVSEAGDPERPIIIGLLDARPIPLAEAAVDAEKEVVIDGERLVLEGQTEVVLRCGGASLTLTRDGKVVVRGEELLSRASGRNKIKGATVQIN